MLCQCQALTFTYLLLQLEEFSALWAVFITNLRELINLFHLEVRTLPFFFPSICAITIKWVHATYKLRPLQSPQPYLYLQQPNIISDYCCLLNRSIFKMYIILFYFIQTLLCLRAWYESNCKQVAKITPTTQHERTTPPLKFTTKISEEEY